MTTNTMSNNDSPLYLEKGRMRFAFSEQELSLRNELISAYSGPITVDWGYGRALKRGVSNPDPNIRFYTAGYFYEDFCNNVLPQNLVIWRNDYKNRPVELRSKKGERMLVVLEEKFHKKLESDAYNKIYCNGGTIAYRYIT